MAAILGVDPYRGPLHVWREKLGLVADVSTPRMAMGTRAQSLVCETWAAQRRGRWAASLTHTIVRVPGALAMCSPDAEARQGRWRCGVEAKYLSGFASDEWRDLPEHTRTQARWQACVQRRPVWVAALFGGFEYREWRVEPDADWFDATLATMERWWERYVVTREPPPDTLAHIRAAPGSDAPVIRSLAVAGGDLDDLAWQLEQARWEAADQGRAIDLMQGRVVAAMGPHYGVEGHGWLATYAPNKNGVRSFRFQWTGEGGNDGDPTG